MLRHITGKGDAYDAAIYKTVLHYILSWNMFSEMSKVPFNHTLL